MFNGIGADADRFLRAFGGSPRLPGHRHNDCGRQQLRCLQAPAQRKAAIKAIFGIVSLLIVLATVGWVAKAQLHAVGGVPAVPSAEVASQAVVLPEYAGTPAVAGHAQDLEQKARDDVARALQQGAERNGNAER